MQNLLGFAATLLAAFALYVGAKQAPPTPGELSTLQGIAGNVQIVPATRRSPEYAMLQVLISPHEHKLIKTFDVPLARDVLPNVAVEIELFQGPSLPFTPLPEAWVLKQDGVVKRSYEQTLAVRGPQIAKDARNTALFSAYGVAFIGGAIIIRHRRRARCKS